MNLFEDDINFYIVSELMGGGDLYKYMLKAKRLSERNAASLIKQTLQAINYMHKQKILHRDLKPENILLEKQEPEVEGKGELNIKLTDFGLATPFQEGVKIKEKMGSPIYMAPEIVKDEKYDNKIDIWGIGIIAHILLCGCPPFDGKSDEQIQNAIIKENPKFGGIKRKLTQEAV